MPGPVITTDPADNVLELNRHRRNDVVLQHARLDAQSRFEEQADVFLNGVPYLQAVNDVTTGTPMGIHFEPGIWLEVPATTNPHEPFTVTRMASIPHGTTIIAQGIALPPVAGKPTIAAIDITPFIGGQPGKRSLSRTRPRPTRPRAGYRRT